MTGTYTKEELISELQELADKLGKTPGCNDMDAHGNMSKAPYFRAFGSWNNALECAGFTPSYYEHSEEDLLDELKDLAERLGRSPTGKQMNELGEYASSTYVERFGGWNEALRLAGFDVNKRSNIEQESLLDEIERLAEELARPPTSTEMAEIGKYADSLYQDHFESWRQALRKAGYEPHRKDKRTVECGWCGEFFEKYCAWIEKSERDFCSEDCRRDWMRESDVVSGKSDDDGRGGRLENKHYGHNWEERRKTALERDGYECQSCGLSQEEHRRESGHDLHVHHKIRFREFVSEDGAVDYEKANALDNLITYCSSCHNSIEKGGAVAG
jgi:hypothetical protein